MHSTGTLQSSWDGLRTLSGAQLRVMVPIAMLSGFVNDTPLVTVTLPIVIQWARKINLSNRFVLIPLSFAALLGGVCTLIGTSTNLVVAGLLQEFYPDNPDFQNMPLFALGQYGVPVTLVGITYVILATPLLLARRGGGTHQSLLAEETEDVLLPARLTQWSPAAGRTIQRSGLRDTGGIYLVRVKRQATGNIHHAVGPEFVIEAGDILYFTGLIEEFGEFCTEHGLQVMTNEVVENELLPSDDASVDDDNELITDKRYATMRVWKTSINLDQSDMNEVQPISESLWRVSCEPILRNACMSSFEWKTPFAMQKQTLLRCHSLMTRIGLLSLRMQKTMRSSLA